MRLSPETSRKLLALFHINRNLLELTQLRTTISFRLRSGPPLKRHEAAIIKTLN
jgi:hypothetical protein